MSSVVLCFPCRVSAGLALWVCHYLEWKLKQCHMMTATAPTAAPTAAPAAAVPPAAVAAVVKMVQLCLKGS